jgi:ABC-2 type transport system permease protein
VNRVWMLAKREFRSYFDHPTAYILVIAFLALALFLTIRALLGSGAATMRGLFALMPWLMGVFVPAITMRSLAEERRSGTLEWLLAHPLTELDVLLGKFLGDWLFVLAALAGTLPMAFGVLLISQADGGVMVAQYVGAALLAAQFVAIGLFASSATRNQITAFVLALAINYVLILSGLRVVTMGLPPWAADAVLRLAVLDHFEAITRGVLDLRDVLYFVSTGGVFLAVAYLLVARERLSAARGAIRRLRVGVTAAVAGVLVLNLLGARIYGRVDLTRDNLYTLSPGTRQALRDLNDVITVKLVVSRELPPEVALTVRDVRDLLADYRRASDGKFRVIELNPDADSSAAEDAASLGIQPIDFNIMRGSEFQVKRGWLGLGMMYADASDMIPLIERTDDLEYRLTFMISNLTSPRRPRVGLVGGYGANWAPYGLFQRILGEYYQIDYVDLSTRLVDGFPPEEFDVLAIVQPTEEWPEEAAAAIVTYLDHGGTALILAEGAERSEDSFYTRSAVPNIPELLEFYGVTMPGGIVYDLRSNEVTQAPGSTAQRPLYSQYEFWPVVLPYGDEVLTRGLSSLTLLWATAFEIADPGRGIRPLWVTTPDAGIQEPGGSIAVGMQFNVSPENLRRRAVALAIEARRERPPEAEGEQRYPAGRLVVVGDTDFLSDNYVRVNQSNLIFALNAVDWLAQDELLIGIRSKNRTPPPLVFQSDFAEAAVTWANLFGVPLLFVLLGGLRVLNRRRISRRRWQEG